MRRNKNQLTLAVRLFIVRCDSLGEARIQAASPAAAKYKAFKMARDAGFFQCRGPFREFLNRDWTVREVLR